MKHLANIVAFLTDLNLVAAEQIESVVDNVIVRPSGQYTRKQQELKIAQLEYSAVIDIERYPHRERSADWLFAQLSAWVIEHPEIRIDPFEIGLVIDVLDDSTADIEIRLTLQEDIIIKPETGGTIRIGGDGYTLA